MRDFFNGWRRKAGCVTLVIACGFAAGWVRSQFRFEYVEFAAGNVVYGVASMHGGLDFYRETYLDPATRLKSIDLESVELVASTLGPFNETPWGAYFQFEWRWDWAGFHIGEGQYTGRRDQDCMIPYWSIVLPLTLLSAYLLLGKPRPAPKQATEPAPAISEPVPSEAP